MNRVAKVAFTVLLIAWLSITGYLLLAQPSSLLGISHNLWATAVIVILIVVTIAFLGYLLESQSCGENTAPYTDRYVAAFVIYAPAIPYVAAAITVIAYIAPPPALQQFSPRWLDNLIGYNPFLAGTAVALLIWLVLPCVRIRNRLAAAAGPDPSTYSTLSSRLNLLEITLKTLFSCMSEKNWDCLKCIAYQNAESERKAITDALKETGLQWVQGTGYIELWKRLHRAEEKLIQLQEEAEVIRAALEDHLRLHGCAMDSKNELMRNLRFAVSGINPEVAPYFTDEPDPPGSGNMPSGSPYPRDVIQTVRQAINEYRDEQRSGVLQVRNALLKTVTFTGFVALSLLGLAVTEEASKDGIVAASAFFLAGAILGLLYHRLRTVIQANNITAEDYGLYTARLWATPLFSGVAAVAGVFLVAVVPDIVNFSAQTKQIPELDLKDIFSLNLSPKFIIAAIFALSPVYLFDRLGQTDKLLSNLRSTQLPNR